MDCCPPMRSFLCRWIRVLVRAAKVQALFSLQLFWCRASGTTSCPPHTRQYINLSSTVSIILGKCSRIVANTKQIIDLRTPRTDAWEGTAKLIFTSLAFARYLSLTASLTRQWNATYTRASGCVPILPKGIPTRYDTQEQDFGLRLYGFCDITELLTANYFVLQIKFLRTHY